VFAVRFMHCIGVSYWNSFVAHCSIVQGAMLEAPAVYHNEVHLGLPLVTQSLLNYSMVGLT